jgi:hypothetical protein
LSSDPRRVEVRPNEFRPWVAVLVTAAAILTYLPYLSLPLLPDDYLQIDLSKRFLSWNGLRDLLADGLYRCRATSLAITRLWLDFFGLSSAAFHVLTILLHAANCLLLYCLIGRLRGFGWSLAGWCAAVFAVRERHHEAVIWLAAVPELLMLGSGLIMALLWIQWVHHGGGATYIAVLLMFCVALTSKESAVGWIPILAILVAWERGHLHARDVLALVPLVAIAIAYAAGVFATQTSNQHFQDGTFSLAAPFWKAFALSATRAIWIWGLLGIGVLLTWGSAREKRLAGFGAAWLPFALLPYSFLTYMPQGPSRHHYFTSVAVAILLAVAAGILKRRWGHRTMIAVAAAFVLQNLVYLWAVKRPQFDLRTQPIERLLEFVKHRRGPVLVRCFPYSVDEAARAVRLRLGDSYAIQTFRRDGTSVEEYRQESCGP